MKNKVLNLAIAGFSLVLGCTSVQALEAAKNLQGCYTAVRGHVETLSLSHTQQLGTYRVVFKHNNWTSLSDEEKSSTRRRFVAAGPILGTLGINSTGQESLSHIMSDKERRGFFISQDDVFTPTSFPESCNSGSGLILTGIESVSIIAGTGIYAGLDPLQSPSIEVEGTFNSCSGKNDFEIIGGQLCFQ